MITGEKSIAKEIQPRLPIMYKSLQEISDRLEQVGGFLHNKADALVGLEPPRCQEVNTIPGVGDKNESCALNDISDVISSIFVRMASIERAAGRFNEVV